MSRDESIHAEPAPGYRPLRVWPAPILLAAIPVTRYLRDVLTEPPMPVVILGMLGPVACGALMLIWWLAASRATVRERLVGALGLVGTLAIAVSFNHSTLGVPGVLMVTAPLGFLAFGIACLLFARVSSFRRTWMILAVAAPFFCFSTLLRSEGMSGSFKLALRPRWEPSDEQRLLAAKERVVPQKLRAEVILGPTLESDLDVPGWPGFRGPNRDSRQRGSVVDPDWATRPIEPVWSIDVGPGWSSFAVSGETLFTQEQRGPNELVVAYQAATGLELWDHPTESRFEDAMGGPGPRATPTIVDNALYAHGASGRLVRLDARNGELVWEQDLRELADREPPMWGFSASPLVTDGLVIVHAGGAGDRGVIALDAETGELAWGAPAGDHSYSSAHLAEIAGQECVLMPTNTGLHVFDPKTGRVKLDYPWGGDQYRALQPGVLRDDVLLPTGMGMGMRRIRLKADGEDLLAEEVWTSLGMKGDFNDSVVFEGHAYGFDGSIFACLDLEDGSRKWKRGRYGSGQVLLLEDSRMLLVISEKGELILVEPNPTKHVELARAPALEGKTWNHPVLVGDRLYVRNSQHAACYRLPLVSQNEPEQPEAENQQLTTRGQEPPT